MSRDAATEAQVRAARPGVSSWVSANAGSGKTRVLTDRVARLLLRGTDPRRILCLTYTKAAAAEMQNRLFQRLGEWAMRPDAELRAALAALDEDAAGIADADLAQARRLFAGALETPGGLKIQTIHSFCDALLRRFPLEAGVSPQFTVMEDRQAAQLRQTLAEKLAQRGDSGFAEVVPHILSAEGRFDDLLKAILSHRERFLLDPRGTAFEQEFGPPPNLDIDRVLPPAALIRLLEAIEAHAGSTEQGLLPLLHALKDGDPAAAETLFEIALKADRAPRSIKAGKPLLGALPDAQERIDAVIGWCVAVEEHRRHARTLDAARALARFGGAFIDAYDAAKRDLGALDFDDLIRLANRLLSHVEARDWVAYKLDGGIDHVLVDEAQDTSPAQWQVIDAVVAEFFAGESARNVTRTLFVVGDEKQSIYSFQGAEPAAFGAQERRYRGRLEEILQTLERCELQFSFRSAPAILEVVDAVSARREAMAAGGATHRAFHDTRPGRVELWPFLPAEPKPPQPDPWTPGVVPKPADPQVTLAGRVARRVAEMIAGETLPGTDRPVAPGDVLILVRRRAALFRAVIRALKAEGVPVAGADRLKVMEEIAPRDLTALLAAIAAPEDDLSLAAALKSPIFGLSEAALYRLAAGREGTLAEALLAAEATLPEAAALYRDIRDRADFLRPYEMLDRILTRHGARRRFAARLGPEAEDAIEALQDLALDYEEVEAPTLTGFLDWLASGDAERKRQLETGGSEVRVMTVHGAKGLEAPVVFLPDTVGGEKGGNSAPLLKVGAKAVALAGTAKTRPQVLAGAEALKVQLEREEYARLLYVAMTRAERWLLVCGAGTTAPAAESWYGVVAQAMEDLGAAEGIDGTRVHATAGIGESAEAPKQAEERPVAVIPPEALPGWLLTKAPAPVPAPAVLTPSGAGASADTAAPAGAGGADAEAARLRGVWLHALLEILPEHPAAARAELAPGILAAQDPAPPPEEAPALVAEALALLADPALGWIFAPGSLPEQEIGGRVSGLGGLAVRGRIDRLVVTETEVWAIDYKSDAAPPETIPPAYATQLALYVAALAEVFPGRTARAAILWTRARRLAPLDQESVTAALQPFVAH